MANRYRYGKRLYSIWVGMRSRCRNPNVTSYERYGGRGITVCDEWQDYENFAQWALSNGYTDEMTIERKDVNGNYCPENCSWIAKGDQARNRRSNCKVTINGVTKTGAEWARENGMGKHTVLARIRNGMDPEEAIKTKSKAEKRLFRGEMLSINGIARKYGVHAATIKSRLARGMTLEEAVFTPLDRTKQRGNKREGRDTE